MVADINVAGSAHVPHVRGVRGVALLRLLADLVAVLSVAGANGCHGFAEPTGAFAHDRHALAPRRGLSRLAPADALEGGAGHRVPPSDSVGNFSSTVTMVSLCAPPCATRRISRM